MQNEHKQKWFALRVKPRLEHKVSELLKAKCNQHFLPVRQELRCWSDRIKRFEIPIFPGYVFSRFDYECRTEILNTPGVQQIVSFGDKPAFIPDEQINSVRLLIDQGGNVKPCDYLSVGQKVRVIRGPLIGAEGLLTRVKTDWRVVVSIDLLHRSVSVDVDRDSVICINPAVPSQRPPRPISWTEVRKPEYRFDPCVAAKTD